MFPPNPGTYLVLLLSLLNFGRPACAQVVSPPPIPSGCGKTYNIQYVSAQRSLMRDVVPMPDGGKVTVGDLGTTDGLVTRYQSNGAIMWTKNINIAGQVMEFRRILQTADGNLLVIGNDYYTQNYYAYRQMVLLKLDYNGNILWCHFWVLGDTEVVDAVATPDNGFVAAFEEYWGAGSSMSVWVARFDANANLVWKRDVSHGAYTPQYKAITCSPDAVFIAYDSYDGSQLDKFGVDRLDLNTGNLVYAQLFTAGSGTTARVNGIFAVNDSAYVFTYRYTSTANNLMAGLDQQGNMFLALNVGTDPLDPSLPAAQVWIDAEPPSVTLTPDQDFWLANRVTISGTDDLEVCRIQRNGTVELNKLHTGINGYLPFNVRAQGKGLVVVGTDPSPTASDVDFIEAFVLKLDSSGQLQTGTAANCVATDRPLTVTTCTECAPATFYYGPATATAGYSLSSSTGTPYDMNNDLTAELDCFQGGTCNAVNILQKGALCALNDTLVYYLDNSANCGAAATWTYDPAYFRSGLISGDSIQLIVQQAGTTTVTAQVEGYCQYFTQTAPVNISLSSLPSLALPADTVICSNGPITLLPTPGFTTYLWSDNSTADSLLVSAPGTYSVVAANTCGTLQATVTVKDANATFHVTPDTVRCNSDTDTLTSTAGYTGYQWSPLYDLAPAGNLAMATPDVTTSYTVTAQRSPGCTVTANVTVTPQSSPPIYLGNDTSICFGDSLLLDAGPGFTGYQWNTGAGTEQLYVHTAGAYSVVANYPNGCVSRGTLELDSIYRPTPMLDTSSVICAGEPRALTPSGGPYDSYLWSDGSTQSSITITSVGSYWVQVTDFHGCVASDTVNILAVKECLIGVFVPNAFTPNGSGHNSLFRPLLYGNFTLLDFVVYDRYGQRVFETRTPLAGWDGTIGGHDAPIGTYVWYCSYQLQGQPPKLDKGTVILIR
jgi:gliding motility-associated-like protein